MSPQEPISGARRRPPIGFAHRGARSERQENTISAFARALELGATGLESDAWLTADGIVVLDHDGVTGPLWRRKALAGQRRQDLPAHIPSLTDLYAACGSKFELSLDVKDPAALKGIVEAAHDFDAVGSLWLCYHDWKVMAGWKAAVGSAHLVESTNLAWISEGLPARCAALAEAGIDAINMNMRQWTAELISEVQSYGLAAFAWDAQTKDDLTRMIDQGVDGMYSDHVGRMMAAIDGAATDRSS